MSPEDRIGWPPSDSVAVKHLIEAAKRGNRSAAEALLAEYVYWVDLEEHPDHELEMYIADAFYEISIELQKPEVALNLPTRRGRPVRSSRQRAEDMSLGAMVRHHLMSNHEMTYEDAVEKTVRLGNASRRKVEREYRAYREYLDIRAREIDPDDKFLDREFHPDRSLEDLEREVRYWEIIESVKKTMKTGIDTEVEAGKVVSEKKDIPIEEVHEALTWYDDWLKSL